MSATIVPMVVSVALATGTTVIVSGAQTPAFAANPCAAKSACNPCNPCAAKANPCNPCGESNPCNPCNPCGAAAKVDITAEEAIAAL